MNSRGQLGVAIADTVTRFVPAPVFGGFKFTTLTAGVAHTCGLSVSKTAFCWGVNTNGQLGDGTLLKRDLADGCLWRVDLPVDRCGRAVDVWTGYYGEDVLLGCHSGRSSADNATGRSWRADLFVDRCWRRARVRFNQTEQPIAGGPITAGQLGDSTTTTRTTPVKVLGGFKFASLSAGDTHTCGRLADNTVSVSGPQSFRRARRRESGLQIISAVYRPRSEPIIAERT